MVEKIIHQYYKKGDVHVNGGDPGLYKVHEIKSKQHTGQRCQRSAPGKLPGEQIDQWHHGNAEQGARNTPAKGIHAKEGNACGDEDLPKGRMRVLICGHVMQEFICGPAMVDFVKIHAVAETAPCRVQMGLVKKGETVICVFRHYNRPPFIQEGELHQGGLVVLQGQP